MKRLFAVLLLLVLCSSVAFADDFDYASFTIYSEVFGASGIDFPSTDIRTKDKFTYHVFEPDNCQIVFLYNDGTPAAISIKGSGEPFLAYCCAALQIIDPEGNKLTGYGNLLICYMLTNGSGEKETGFTASGKVFEIQKTETGFSFLGDM